MNANRRSVAPVRKLVAAVLGTVAAFVMLFGLGMTSWAVVALGAAMLAMAIGLTLINVVRRGARTWVAGTAHVTSASEPPASSAYGRCELQIVVAAPGLPTSAVKVRDPRVPMDRWPVVGDTLPVMVDVDDMRRVRIQWEQMPTHTEAAMNPAAAYPDPLDDLTIEDELLGEPEAPPWVTRDRLWGRGVQETDQPTADLSGQLDDLHAGDPREGSVMVRDAPGGGRIVLEGTLVESDTRSAPLPRRPRPSPRPRSSSGAATTASTSGAATQRPPTEDPDPVGHVGTITGTDDLVAPPDPADPADAAPPDPADSANAASPYPAPTTPPYPAPTEADHAAGRRSQDTPVDLPLDDPPAAQDTAPRPVAVPMGQVAGERPPRPTGADHDDDAAVGVADPEIDVPLDEEPGATASQHVSGATIHDGTRAADPVDKLAVLDPHQPDPSGAAGVRTAAAAAPAPRTSQDHDAVASVAVAAADRATGNRAPADQNPADQPPADQAPVDRAPANQAHAAGGHGSTSARPPRQAGSASKPTADVDNGIDELMTAYPSARPGPAGAIHGVGITVLVTDLGRSVRFYRDTLGFFEIDGGHGSAVLASGDTRLVLRTVHDLSPMTGRLIYLNLEVGDVDAVYEELHAKGVKFVHGPRPVNRGDRLELWAASFQDPDGHNIAVTQWRAIG